jgi:hypothetical protein
MRMFPVDRKSKFRLDAFLGRPDGDAVALLVLLASPLAKTYLVVG